MRNGVLQQLINGMMCAVPIPVLLIRQPGTNVALDKNQRFNKIID